MSMKISRKLIETDTGELFVVSGNPEVGYDLAAVELRTVGHFQRSWQAVKRASELAEGVA